MKASHFAACAVAVVVGMFTAGVASGSEDRSLLDPVLTTVTNVTVDPNGLIQTTTDVVNTTTGTVTDVTDPVTSGDVGGTVGTLLGDVEEAVTAVTGSPTGVNATVPQDTLTSLLVSIFGPSAAGGTPGAPGAPGTTPDGGQATTSGDLAAPRLSFRVLNRLGAAARTGRLRLRITSDEAGVAAFTGALRPIMARRVRGKALGLSHALVRTKAILVAFRRAGAVTVAVKLPARARRNLGRARTARLGLDAWVADLARNQARRSANRTLRR